MPALARWDSDSDESGGLQRYDPTSSSEENLYCNEGFLVINGHTVLQPGDDKPYFFKLSFALHNPRSILPASGMMMPTQRPTLMMRPARKAQPMMMLAALQIM